MRRPGILLASVAACGVLSGCGGSVMSPLTAAVSPSTPSPSAPVAVTAPAARGTVMGGQRPVAGVNLQLYQAGTTGYGSAATALGVAVQTNANGNFDLPSYSCAAGSQVYLVGTGGMPTPTLTNINLALMVGLGTCGGAGLNNFINMNELTTVATVWALAPFMKGPTNIGTSATNSAGLVDAFATINQLVTTTNGTIPGPALPAGAMTPTVEMNTLADMLEQCVNSGGGVAGDSSACGNLFNLAPNAAGTVFPTDTITAALNIAQSPGRNVKSLNKLRSANPVFVPATNVNSPPTDWTIAITYTGGGLNAPTSIAADAAGAIWVTNGGNASVTKLDSTGTAISGVNGFTAGGFSSPSAVAIDIGGNAWVANAGNATMTELNPAGTTGAVYHGNGLSSPASIAIDGSGSVWLANSGSNSVSAFTGSGAVLAGSPFAGAGVTTPSSLAVTPR